MKKKQTLPILIAVGAIVLVFLLILGITLIKKYTPTKEHKDLSEYYGITEDSQVAITLNNTVLDTYAKIIDGHVYVDYEFVHDVLNSRFYWDANENILLYTTANDVISAKADESTFNIGKSSSDYGRIIVKATAESALIDLDFVNTYSDFTYTYYESPSRIVITNDWKEVTICTLRKNTEVRYKGGIKSPILADVKKGDVLTILEADKKWTKVCTEDGITGYVRSNKVKKTESKTLVSEYKEEEFNHIKKEQAISLLWHPVFGSADNSEISSIVSNSKGVDVISPSWFKLKDNKGNISSLASSDYVNYAHNHGVEVWGMVKNFDLASPDIDVNYVLTHTSTRQNLVKQLVAVAYQHSLDGLNIDFESLDESEIGDAYIQFLRELSIECEKFDILLSTAVHVPASFNTVYKYGEQANFVDYICVMTYDQHWGQSSGEGSVASLDWVEESVKNTIAEGVPEDQLLLCVPFYTKLWKLTPTSTEDATEASYMVGFENLGLTSAKNWMDNNISSPEWLSESGQYFGEITKSGVTYKMWLEDEASIEEKLKLMQEYKLAGAAFWSSDLDNDSIWEVIIKYIN